MIPHADILSLSLPIAYMEKIRAVDGVKAVSHMSWFGGIYIDRKNFFANFAVDPEGFLDLYPEFILPEDQRSAFLKDRRGCVVGRGLAKRFRSKWATPCRFRAPSTAGEWPMVVRGIYQGRDKSAGRKPTVLSLGLPERAAQGAPFPAGQPGRPLRDRNCPCGDARRLPGPWTSFSRTPWPRP